MSDEGLGGFDDFVFEEPAAKEEAAEKRALGEQGNDEAIVAGGEPEPQKAKVERSAFGRLLDALNPWAAAAPVPPPPQPQLQEMLHEVRPEELPQLNEMPPVEQPQVEESVVESVVAPKAQSRRVAKRALKKDAQHAKEKDEVAVPQPQIAKAAINEEEPPPRAKKAEKPAPRPKLFKSGADEDDEDEPFPEEEVILQHVAPQKKKMPLKKDAKREVVEGAPQPPLPEAQAGRGRGRGGPIAPKQKIMRKPGPMPPQQRQQQQLQQQQPQPPPPVHPTITPSIEAFPVGAPDVLGFVMDREHLSQRVVELYEQPDASLEGVDCNELITMLSQGDWTTALWAGVDYYGNVQYKDAKAMEPNLKALISYVETNPKAAPDMKPKLRFVVKELRNNEGARGVVVMLASHAGVCNVQKEIGVRLAYSTMAETVKSDCDANDIRNSVLRVLYALREMCVEGLYCAQELRGNKSLNSHPLMGYRNPIAKQIGLDVVPDPDTSDSQVVRRISVFLCCLSHIFSRRIMWRRFLSVFTLWNACWDAWEARSPIASFPTIASSRICSIIARPSLRPVICRRSFSTTALTKAESSRRERWCGC
jgi:hypothetical protein